MFASRLRYFSALIALALLPALASVAYAQEGLPDNAVGQNEKLWRDWKAAMRLVDRGQLEEASPMFEALATEDTSDLRYALMADRTGTTRLEFWSTQDDAPQGVKTIVEKIKNGRRQRGLAEDGWHFAAVGRFKMADANFKALIESEPDPVGLLELARRNPNRNEILIRLINNTTVGDSAVAFIKLLEEGERQLRTNPFEIEANIAKLGGPPRMVYNATNRLRDAGEYAIPHMIQALQDPSRADLHAVLIQTLSQMGRGALNPLVQALGMDDDVTKAILIRAAGDIGYKQAVPYLVELVQDTSTSPIVQSASREALQKLGIGGGFDPARLFLELAEMYYDDAESLQPVKVADLANIWYLRDGELRYIPVPTPVFNDVMAMRCAEEVLNYNDGSADAIALWLAANTRREAKLGMNVESDVPDPLGNKDSTRPANTPRAIYFNRAAGAQYNHMMLQRAVEDKDPPVALGAIAALRSTAGEANLIGNEDYKQALVQALSFPNRQVRFKAAEALALAKPDSQFTGAQNVVPVLAESLKATEGKVALLVMPDLDTRNKFVSLLRANDYSVASGSTLYAALQDGREKTIGAYDAVFLGLQMSQPDVLGAVGELRGSFDTASVPILVIADDVGRGNRLTRGKAGVELLDQAIIDIGDSDRIKDAVESRISRASSSLGLAAVDRDSAMELAIRAAEALEVVGESSVFDVDRAEPAMVSAIRGDNEKLRIEVAGALAMVNSASAQEVLTEVALNADHNLAERIAQFDALAKSGRRYGNLMGDSDVVQRLIDLTLNESDLILRAGASKALGALNIKTNKASEIIRSQHNG